MNCSILMKVSCVFCFLILSVNTLAWDGEDTDGNTVTISKGNLVRTGETITIEHDGEEKEVTVESIRSRGHGASLEMTDEATGETIEADMD